MDGHLLARRIVCIAVRERATKKFFFSLSLFIDLIAFAVQYVSGLCLPSRVRVQHSYNGRVRVVHLRHFSGLHGFGSHFQIKHGSGSVPCSIFTGLFGFGYEFLDPWRPLVGSAQCKHETYAVTYMYFRFPGDTHHLGKLWYSYGGPS